MKIYRILITVLNLVTATVVNAEKLSAIDLPVDNSKSFIGDNGVIRVGLVTIDPKEFNIRIVSVPFELKRANVHSEFEDFSLRLFAQTILTLPKYHGSDVIVVNGGFSSYRVDIPFGLLIVDENVYSTAYTESEETDSSLGASVSGSGVRRFNGIICQRKDDNNWDIMAIKNYKPGICKQALQAGPLLVEPDNKIGISSNETDKSPYKTIKSPYSRTVICLTEDSKMKIVISEKTYLFHLAQWLSTAESKGGLGCRVAINLSGDTSSGIAIKQSKESKIWYIGDGSFPLPSALIIERKTK